MSVYVCVCVCVCVWVGDEMIDEIDIETEADV